MRNERVSYREDDVEWHPSFGKRHGNRDEDDEVWQDEEDSSDFSDEFEDESEFADLAATICFLSQISDDPSGKPLDKLVAKTYLDQVVKITEEHLKNISTEMAASSEVVDENKADVSREASAHRHEPSTFEEAMKDPAWLESMRQEMKSLLDNKTWILVDLPKGRKIVKNKWVYKIKSDGRLKSRLVAKGFTQVFGVDFDETWSPVGRRASLKLLIWFVLRNNWSWKQMDVDTAFLNSNLDEEIYMQQPKGFDDGSRKACRLLKSIYGLKQASRAWYLTLKEFLESQSLKRSRVNHLKLLMGISSCSPSSPTEDLSS